MLIYLMLQSTKVQKKNYGFFKLKLFYDFDHMKLVSFKLLDISKYF